MSTNKRPDGLEDYTLGKDYGPHRAGDTIPVDPERRDWLNANGYQKGPKPRPPKKDLVVADAAINERFATSELSHPPFTTEKEI